MICPTRGSLELDAAIAAFASREMIKIADANGGIFKHPVGHSDRLAASAGSVNGYSSSKLHPPLHPPALALPRQPLLPWAAAFTLVVEALGERG